MLRTPRDPSRWFQPPPIFQAWLIAGPAFLERGNECPCIRRFSIPCKRRRWRFISTAVDLGCRRNYVMTMPGEIHSRHARTTPRSLASTRERILAAAAIRFARHSYEQTGLRDIAADVGVDVAYVHRCFGSKAGLFAEAVRSTIEPDRLLAGDARSVPATLAAEVFSRAAAPGEDCRRTVAPLDIMVRSLSSPEALRVLREVCSQHFIGPLARKLDESPGRRAALIAGFMVGVGILREVLCVRPLIEGEKGDLEVLMAAAIRDMIGPGCRCRAERGQQRTEDPCNG